jgi:hypothetical protein
LAEASAIWLQDTPGNYRPIVQAIDRPDRNQKLALVYETKVGPGKLLVCTLDLNRDLDHRTVARQLRQSLLAYAASDAFNPQIEIPLDHNLPSLSRVSTLARLSPKLSASSEHENHWVIYAADNNPDTFWSSNWNPPEPSLPHWLIIELPRPQRVAGFLETPRQDDDRGRIAQYTISASNDGKSWQKLAEGNWPNTADIQKVMLKNPISARFFKLESLREVRNRPLTSVAEFDVLLKAKGRPAVP